MQDPKGQDATTILTKLSQRPQEIHLQRPVGRPKRRKEVMKHGISNTPPTPMTPSKSLIPSHLFSSSVRPRYDEGVQEVEELRSTTDLRQRVEARREIYELNR